MHIYLIRHAQSENNALTPAKIHKRKVDPGLTTLGFQQRDLLAQFLDKELDVAGEGFEINHLYTSAMYRTLLTTQPISDALGIRPTVWPELHELGGMYQSQNGNSAGFGGMTRGEILREFPRFDLPSSVTDSGWYDADLGFEPIANSVERARAVARALRAWSESERVIALVSHAGFLNLLLPALDGDMPFRKGWRYYHFNTAVTRIDFHEGQPILHYMNRAEHLPVGLRTF